MFSLLQGPIYFTTADFPLRHGSSEISQTSSWRTASPTGDGVDLLPSKAEKSHHSLKSTMLFSLYTLKTGDNLDSFLLETKVFFDNWSHEKEATPLSAKLCSQSRQGNRWSLTSKQMLRSSSSQTSLATRAIYSGFVSSHYMANIF